MGFFRVLVFLAVCCVAMADYRQEALELHNRYRVIHNAPRMRLSRRLNSGATRYARNLFQRFGVSRKLKHSDKSTRPGVGENLFVQCIWPPAPGREGGSVQDAAKSWYDEVCRYNFNYDGYQKGLGHFSQMVWKASTELGIGKYTGTKSGKTCTYIVARYKDVGNVNSREYFRNNVERGNFNDSYCRTVKDKSVGNDEYLDAPGVSTERESLNGVEDFHR